MKDELAKVCLNGNPAHRDTVLLCDSQHAIATEDAAEKAAWNGWAGPRYSVKAILGEGLMAAAAWQCVAAVDALKNNHVDEALVSVVGANQQAIGAAFKRSVPGQGT
jgi:hypothetical protein